MTAQITVDVAAIEEAYKTDSTLISLSKKKERWKERQRAKGVVYAGRIKELRGKISEILREISVKHAEARILYGRINKLKSLGRYRSAGLRTIEREITRRKIRIKAFALARATAKARREASRSLALR